MFVFTNIFFFLTTFLVCNSMSLKDIEEENGSQSLGPQHPDYEMSLENRSSSEESLPKNPKSELYLAKPDMSTFLNSLLNNVNNALFGSPGFVLFYVRQLVRSYFIMVIKILKRTLPNNIFELLPLELKRLSREQYNTSPTWTM